MSVGYWRNEHGSRQWLGAFIELRRNEIKVESEERVEMLWELKISSREEDVVSCEPMRCKTKIYFEHVLI